MVASVRYHAQLLLKTGEENCCQTQEYEWRSDCLPGFATSQRGVGM